MTKLKEALIDAYDSEMAGLEAEASTAPEHVFSAEFEHKMKAAFKIAERRYVHVGRIRMRRAVMLAVIVALLVATTLATIAVAKPGLYYRIIKNSTNWEFLYDNTNQDNSTEKIEAITPDTPEGYRLSSQKKTDQDYYLTYINSNDKKVTITYSQETVSDNGIDHLDSENNIHKTRIDGYEAIEFYKKGTYCIYWNDNKYVYTLLGNCDHSTLKNLVMSVINQFDKKTK
ncbi:DUF4367 domain-containing protein [Aminicella lysinilytica]|uniref:Uncharacterized protein DUF4367 n=1 Tax=Aminicella lysinilytica TaxID=433323 RepID=A0A4R6PXC7_9FIRM|nr:DUF4367 domain-containing protein [Aminicella lysinilytica]TDP46647.1 uncharacterized protein DUF4367 [Aminicella lysinilytica]